MIDYLKTHRIQAIVLTWIIISLVVVILAIAFIHDSRNHDDYDSVVDDEETGIVEIPDYIFGMSNRAELSAEMSNAKSLVVFDNLESIVLSPSERETAPHENAGGNSDLGVPGNYFMGIIRDLSVTSNPNDASGLSMILSFALEISDGRIYTANVIISETAGYVATLVRRGDIEIATPPWLFINIRGVSDESDAEIIEWARSLGVGSEDLTIEHIALPEN